MKKALAFMLAVMLILTSSAALAELKPWSRMKNFKVKTGDGSMFDLYKTLEEKDLVLIDLWFIDCIYCPPASASLQAIQDKYKDRVAFIALNPYDNAKDIKAYEEGRGLSIPCAKFGGAASWTDAYPTFVLVDKDGTVLCTAVGASNPYSAEAMLEWALSLTPEEKAEYKSKNLTFGWFDGDKLKQAADPTEVKQREAFVKSSYSAYNMKRDMSLEVSGESVSRIVIDTNADILQRIDMTGEYRIIPPYTPFTVTVKTEKGFKPAKAYMTVAVFDSPGAFTYNNNWSGFCGDIPFKDAKKDKNSYTFDLETPGGDAYFYFLESGEMINTIKDSVVGLHTFPSEAAAEAYLNAFTRLTGYELKWHVE